MILLRNAGRFHAGKANYGLAAAMALAMVYLISRGFGAYPAIFADEWLYSSSSRLMPLAESLLPSYLYLALYGHTSVCGTGFLECARVLNVVLFIGSAPFLYLVARRLCSAPVAAAVAMLSLLGPVNSYTMYFMPEAMYFFGFAVLSWIALNWHDAPPLRYGLVIGAVLGLMSLVKIHALFLSPALVGFMLYLCWSQFRADWLRRFATMAPLTLMAMAATKFLVGYLLAGKAGTTLFGTFYGNQANSSGSAGRLLQMVPDAFINFSGHALALALLMGLAIACIVLQVASPAVRNAATRPQRLLQVYAALTLGATLGMTVMFTASLVREVGPTELMRLHLRYYSFVFPFLLIAAAATLTTPDRDSKMQRVLVAVPLAALMLFGLWKLNALYRPWISDGPEIYAMASRRAGFYALGLLHLLLLAVWVWRRRLGVQLLVFGFIPLMVIKSETDIRAYAKLMRQPNIVDQAGEAAHRYLPQSELSKMVVVGDIGSGSPQRALFQVDAPNADWIAVPPDSPFDRSEIPPGRDWVLILGNHALPPELKPVLSNGYYALVKVAGLAGKVSPVQLQSSVSGKTIGPDAPPGEALTAHVEGLSGSEKWGAWSEAKQIRFQFDQPLPAKLSVTLKGNAFGPNVGRDFFLEVGGQRQRFKLTDQPLERLLVFDTDGTVKNITIEVPEPVSPLELGYGPDNRKLGMALHTVAIGTR